MSARYLIDDIVEPSAPASLVASLGSPGGSSPCGYRLAELHVGEFDGRVAAADLEAEDRPCPAT